MTTDEPTTDPLTQEPLTPTQVVERRAEVLRRHNSGETFTQISKAMGVSRQAVHQLYWRAVRSVPAKAVHEIRDDINAHLASLLAHTNDIRSRDHVKVNNGVIVKDEDGQPLLDDGPEVDAIREARALLEQIAKLNGANAPAQVTVNGQITYQVNGVDLGNLS
jgi:hypothetical protein